MANQKISELTAIATIDNATDVLPIVDTSATTTKKITLTQVKTSLALNNVDNTSDANKPVSSATQTALDAKQATLVSGTNIKTINSTSLLGSGDISISASPSGVAGAIQFSNGSAFASDATNLFWDDTNNRLGVGTNAPSGTAHFKGSGSTSATTSLLVQNSAGVDRFKIQDDGTTTLTVSKSTLSNSIIGPEARIAIVPYSASIGTLFNSVSTNGGANYPVTFWATDFFAEITGGLQIATSAVSVNASAKLQVDSTTRGFLPPRMTTTQKNAIATPSAGLVVYDNTTNKLCCYNGSTWNDLF